MNHFKIVHVLPSLNNGGAERFVVDLINELSLNKELEIHLVILFDITPSMFLASEISENIKVHTLGKKLGFDYSIIFKVFKLLKSIKPDVVHSHLRSFEYLILSMLMLKTKLFHTLHSEAIKECPSKIIRTLRRSFYKRKVRPITISELSAQSFKDVYKLNNDRIIYNGRCDAKKTELFNQTKIEIDSLKKNKDTKVFLNVGNIGVPKNQSFLANCFNELKEENCILLIVGDVRVDYVYEQLKEHKSEKVHILGKRGNVSDYMILSDFFIMSSIIEGMPMTIIEALSSLKVIVSTPAGGIPNMIDESCGFLSKSFSKEDFKSVVMKAMSLDEESYSVLARNGRKIYEEKFSIKTSSVNHLNYYNLQ